MKTILLSCCPPLFCHISFSFSPNSDLRVCFFVVVVFCCIFYYLASRFDTVQFLQINSSHIVQHEIGRYLIYRMLDFEVATQVRQTQRHRFIALRRK